MEVNCLHLTSLLLSACLTLAFPSCRQHRDDSQPPAPSDSAADDSAQDNDAGDDSAGDDEIEYESYTCVNPGALPSPCSSTSGLSYETMRGSGSGWAYGYGAFVAGTAGQSISNFQPTLQFGWSGPSYSVNTPLPDGLTLNATNGTLSGTPTVTVPNCTFIVTVNYSGGNSSCYFELTVNQPNASGAFTTLASSMTQVRNHPLAVTLASGKVLIVGGTDNSGNYLNTAEVYDPSTKHFTATGSRTYYGGVTAVLLNDNTVLVAGGYTNSSGAVEALTLEIFHPDSGTFTSSSASLSHLPKSATLLGNGKVLFTEGNGTCDVNTGVRSPDNNAEIYDPSGDSVASAGFPGGTSSTLMASGHVLIRGFAGCLRNAIFGTYSDAYSVSSQDYNPSNQSLNGTGDSTAEGNGTSPTPSRGALLSNNKIVFSDLAGAGNPQYIQLYDPAHQTYSNLLQFLSSGYGSLGEPLLLPSGTIVLRGASQFNIYNLTGSSVSATYMTKIRSGYATAILGDGSVLVVGGADQTAEYYRP